METLLVKIADIAREAGQIIKNADRNNIAVNSKEGKANFVTEYDTKIQRFLEEKLEEILPEAKFMGEEDNKSAYTDAEYVFVVDPIDGTQNFIKDLKLSVVSIGLLKNKRPYIGVIYNPYVDQLFYAQKGEGAFCNGERIHVSDQPLEQALIIFGSAPYYPDLCKKTMEMAYDLLMKGLDIRRSGSAAWDLCCVASGKAEMFFELMLSPWDFAAGCVLVEEAGGTITTIEGNKLEFDKKQSILAKGINVKYEKHV